MYFVVLRWNLGTIYILNAHLLEESGVKFLRSVGVLEIFKTERKSLIRQLKNTREEDSKAFYGSLNKGN